MSLSLLCARVQRRGHNASSPRLARLPGAAQTRAAPRACAVRGGKRRSAAGGPAALEVGRGGRKGLPFPTRGRRRHGGAPVPAGVRQVHRGPQPRCVGGRGGGEKGGRVAVR